ncbi:hypothetical protein SAMN04488020_1242 [Palleronia marisminoris]|uniref:Uncharacterized protein n=1 Tax=Palleronia marisminoris TaxID=315423 RepID=A0A1Y5TT98_9RHOB|nr:hypothetical protein SAMN04488020_1242 [Palleronia marisminoris]SLN71935.1 hypothetical protein PAM7066_03697 [Palleronia marisminoris]
MAIAPVGHVFHRRVRLPFGNSRKQPIREMPAPFPTLGFATETTQVRVVAQAVWRAVTDQTAPMKLPARADAETWFGEEGLATPQPRRRVRPPRRMLEDEPTDRPVSRPDDAASLPYRGPHADPTEHARSPTSGTAPGRPVTGSAVPVVVLSRGYGPSKYILSNDRYATLTQFWAEPGILSSRRRMPAHGSAASIPTCPAAPSPAEST